MAVLVGIDEAGYGPILGPLVVSSAAFSLPRESLSRDLWQVLSRSVAIRRKHIGGRLLICDSKKAFNRTAGVKSLSRTVLACLRCMGRSPTNLSGLLEILCQDVLGRLGQYPWYKDSGDYPLEADVADMEIAAKVFADDLQANGMGLLAIRSRCLDVGQYNEMINSVKNKASVLFTCITSLIKAALDVFGDQDLQIIVDRQGGRVKYRRVLQRMFEGMELQIISESAVSSSYELRGQGRAMRVHFVVGADERYLCVSLASMVSKYLRELMMDCINRYFAGFGVDLKPTAGYWTDGLRFIEDLRKLIPDVQIQSDLFIRSR